MLKQKKEDVQEKKFNVLIMGCGGQGALADMQGTGNEHKIISFANAFKKHKNTNEIIFYDMDIEKAKEAATIWNCIFTCDLELALKHADIVIIATPDNKHYELLKKSAGYNLKLVICEKPLCEDIEKAREIVELYKQKNIPLMINYTRRFLPYYDKLKQYGKPLDGYCIFNRGWLHTGTHAIDFFEMLNLNNYKLIEENYPNRFWVLKIKYDNYIFTEERYDNMPVWDYCDKATWHLAENAYNFLEGKEGLKCTGEDGLKALKICYKLMGAK